MKLHRHKFTMVRPGALWLCTQGNHNRFEANGYQGFRAIVWCYDPDAGCAQGWCVDCIPTRAPQRGRAGR